MKRKILQDSVGTAASMFIDPPLERVDDLAVYTRLVRVSDELEVLARACWSPFTGRAVSAAAIAVRRMASVIYRATFRGKS